MPAHSVDLLTDLALILCVAAVTTTVFQRLRQPVVLGYLLAGVVVGPHLPVPLFVDEPLTHTMSELGVVLLMFSLGLEFSLRKLIKIAPTAGIVAVIQCSLMIWLGYLVARLFGWTLYEALFAGSALAISSTTIIVKAFAEQKVKGRLTEIVFGILIVEDLIAILLLTVLTAVASGAGRRIRRREGHRAPDRTRARRVRGGVLRLGRHADRSAAGLAEPARGAGADGRGRGGQADRRRDRDVHRRLRRAHVRASRHEPGPDRRVLVHHRRGRAVDRRHPTLSLPVSYTHLT